MDTTTPSAPSENATAPVSEATSAPPAASAPVPTVVPAPASPSVVTQPPAPILLPEQPLATPLREDQIQNAVGFLSHPQVRGSTNTASKRSFLERKGLTAAEIEEAFRRVPEAPPAATAPAAPQAPAPSAPQPVAQATQAPAAPGQQLALAQQPYAVPPNQAGTQLVAAHPAAVAHPTPNYRWSQLVLGVGVVAAAGWAVHQLVVPRVRALLESWQAARREAEEARHKELMAAVEGLKGCQEELKVSTQALLEAVTVMKEQQRTAGGAVDSGFPPRGPASGRYAGPSTDGFYQNGRGSSGRYDGQYGNNSGLLGSDHYAAVRAAAGSGYTNVYPPDTLSYNYGRDSGPATAGSTGGDGGRGGAPVYGMPTPPYGSTARVTASGPYGGSGSGGAAAQQQEGLPYKVTAPPSPTLSAHSQPTGRPSAAPQPSGGYGGMGAPYGSNDRLYDAAASGAAQAQEGGDGDGSGVSRTVPRPPPEQPVYPQSFHEVMEMVAKGITPPNVRTDINDTPPDPTRPLSEARMAAPLKPWERATPTAGGGGGGAAAAPSVYGNNGPMAAAPPSKTNGMYGLGSAPSDAVSAVAVPTSPSLALPATAYGMPVATTTAGGPSNSGGGGSAASASSSLSVLPPVNPTWRPPPPPMRTVTSTSSSPPSTSMTGMAGGSGGGSDAAASSGVDGVAPSAAAAPAAAAAAAGTAAPAAVLPPAGVGAGAGPVDGPTNAVAAALPPDPAAAPTGQALSINAAQVPSGSDMAPSSPTPVQPPFAAAGPDPAASPATSAPPPLPLDGGATPRGADNGSGTDVTGFRNGGGGGGSW